ncbi:GNAT family N-acetyltransferase [Nonomuraea aridisoli]|uniref:GNAT family N-acetyltransferase n=1 Tax=Nonomuraea aridisoli TaxID=2070368 RepID=A0A2W2EC44_9ACTN|nr:GNAT family N-acetyltransferase [Nonomuraea aridisoli]PZG14635.1 GNAT family N-acetyltransferase [Nonomuraea aridisoli]
MSFDIRSAGPEDSAAIEEVRIASWRVAYRGVVPDAYLDGMEVRPRLVRERAEAVAGGRLSGVVAVRDGSVHGFTLYGASRDDDIPGMEVYAIYVLPGDFSTGMGRALMTATTQDMAASGCTETGLWVLTDNPRARRFYERRGFTPSGRTKLLGDPPLEEMHYRLTLSART